MIRSNATLLEYISKPTFLKKWRTITQTRHEPSAVIIDQQSRSNSVYIIKRGMTKCFLTEDTGIDFIQEFFGAGELFGEIEFFTQSTNFCSVVTVSETEVFKFENNLFKLLLDTDRQFNSLVMQALAMKVKYKAIRHAYNQSHRIEDKVLRLKKEYPLLFDKLQKKDIANYLGITMRSLNRALNMLDTNYTISNS
ncbi:Crp/Fnr family transcriptional regulator [Aquimarina sp. 2-A2]|uniref:Crp/Fnr family transcriptional regulator n=1 Tax=Aquimarina sp. 2-A2 TaxID=3382644 RepID=UPI00387F2C66